MLAAGNGGLEHPATDNAKPAVQAMVSKGVTHPGECASAELKALAPVEVVPIS